MGQLKARRFRPPRAARPHISGMRAARLGDVTPE
eukprot:IDg9351t1